MFPLRVALSGRAHGPDLWAILELLGNARSSTRLQTFLSMLAP
jgi:glutamyl/glutaminyl-tRNA synthetase